MSMITIVVLVAFLCVIVLFAMVNVPKESSKEQEGSEDESRITDIENDDSGDDNDNEEDEKDE